MKKRVYWSSIEYKYDASEKKLEGGYVYVFIRTFDVRTALKIILMTFEIENLDVHDIEFIKPYTLKTGWEDPRRTIHYEGIYNEAMKSRKLIFDTFYAYER